MTPKRFFLPLMAVAALAAASCTKLGGLEDRMDDLESRVSALETQVKTLNANVEATAELMKAGTIHDVSEKNGTWTITLSDGRVITLTQGSIGVGSTPVMTIDAEGYWMVDYGAGNNHVLNNGQKVKATGADGTTPVFGVNAGGNWTVSYDGGSTFTEVLGADGKPVSAVPGDGSVSDSYFKDVKYVDDVFTLILKDGTVLTVPVVSGFLCSISGAEGLQVFANGETKTYTVTLEGVSQTIVTAPAGWAASLEGATLSVTAPVTTKGSIADTRTDVTILALSGTGYAVAAKVKVTMTPQEETISDLYEAYQDGKDIEIAGVKYNMSTGGEGILLKAENASDDLRAHIHQKSGVFFLEQADGAWFDIPSVTEITGDVILVGRYTDKPVTVRPTMCMKLKGGSFVMKNLVFDMAAINGGTNATYAFNNANATADLTRLHFDGCRFLNVQKPVLYANVAGYGFKGVVVKGCTFQLVYTSGNVPLFNFYGSTVLHTYKELTFEDNVVFNATCTAVQIFQYNQNIAQTGSPWECPMSVKNNIFYNCPSGNGHFKFFQLASLKMNANIFWGDPSSTLASYGFILYSPAQDASVVDATGNIAYGLASGKNWLLAHTNSTVVPESNILGKLEEDPFESFDTSSGAYKLKAAYTAYGPRK